MSRKDCHIYGKLRRSDFLPVGEEREDEVLERGYDSESSGDECARGMQYVGIGSADPFNAEGMGDGDNDELPVDVTEEYVDTERVASCDEVGVAVADCAALPSDFADAYDVMDREEPGEGGVGSIDGEPAEVSIDFL